MLCYISCSLKLILMTYLSCSRVLWSRFRRGFPVRSSSWSLGGRFSGRVISLSSLQLRSTHWQQRPRCELPGAHAQQGRGTCAAAALLLSSPSAAWLLERPRWSWSGRWACASADSSWWWWARSSACFRSGPPPPAPPTLPFYYEEQMQIWTFVGTNRSCSLILISSFNECGFVPDVRLRWTKIDPTDRFWDQVFFQMISSFNILQHLNNCFSPRKHSINNSDKCRSINNIDNLIFIKSCNIIALNSPLSLTGKQP